jgi:TPR repeat protein
MSVWALLFTGMSASGYLSDRHPGQWTPFWEQACAAERRDACLNLYVLHDGYCADGSAWSCNEIGILLAERYDNPAVAAAAFNRACTLGFAAGCDNSAAIGRAGPLRHDAPTAADYRYVLRGSKGPIVDLDAEQLYARACDLGWPGTCRS